MSVRLEKKHPLAIRWFHWLNFPAMTVMTWSGLMIYWANDVYFIQLGPNVIHFALAAKDCERLHLDGRLAEGMAWHFTFAWLFALNGLAYVLYVAFSGEWRQLLPNRRSLKEALLVIAHDMFLTKKKPPRSKFNGAQRFAYTGIVALGLLELLTGLAIFKPIQLRWLAALFGGYQFARIIHFCGMIGFVLFFLVHVIQVVRVGWNNFRAMITGYELTPVAMEAKD